MFREFLKSSVGQKAVMSLTGLALSAFVIAHMLGNLLIFIGPGALNAYAKKLKDAPFFLWPARVLLAAVLVIHIVISLKLARENKKARPRPYARMNTVQASLPSRTMVVTGLFLFLFIVYHLLHFTVGWAHPDVFHEVDALGRHDVYAMVVLSFQNVWISGTYILAMFFLCLHLSHGLASFPQSLGFSNDAARPWLQKLAWAVSLLIFFGNSSIPAAVLLGIIRLGRGGA